MKHDWKKEENEIYGVKTKPCVIDIPAWKYIILSGSGNPNDQVFSDKVAALFSMDRKGAGFTVEHIPVRFRYEILLPECREFSVFWHLWSVLYRKIKFCSCFFKNTSVFIAVFLLLVKE